MVSRWRPADVALTNGGHQPLKIMLSVAFRAAIVAPSAALEALRANTLAVKVDIAVAPVGIVVPFAVFKEAFNAAKAARAWNAGGSVSAVFVNSHA